MERPDYGAAVELEPGLRLVLARNPSPMTHWGTNSYILGTDPVVVVDPGPEDPGHLAALQAAIGGARVEAVVVTHPHRDHSPLARRLARSVRAPVLGFGPPEAGRRPVMQALAAEGALGGGEGVDAGFRPDATIGEGDRIAAGGLVLEILHTPGHFAGHLSLALGDAVLTGDHVMGWASTLVSPPDGDVASFRATSARLRARADRVYFPGHGAPVADPAERLDWLVAHRLSRESAIVEALARGATTVEEIAHDVYTGLAPPMLPAARRNVLAHLVDLHEKAAVVAEPALGAGARFRLV